MWCLILDFVIKDRNELGWIFLSFHGNVAQLLVAVIFTDSILMCLRVHNLLLI